MTSIDAMLDPNASYRDLEGQAQLAWDLEHTALQVVADKCKIDTNRYDVIGIGIMFAELDFFLNLYIADKNQLRNGKRRVRSILTEMKYKEFFKLVKDLSITLFKPYDEYEKIYQYEGEAEIENVKKDD